MHKETSKFKHSVLTLASPASSVGITDNEIIYVAPTTILYENMKPIEHVLLHPICLILSHLMCACKHCNIKYLYVIEHIEVADESITSKNTDFTRFLIIKPRHPGRLKKQIWVEKPCSVGFAWSHVEKHQLP